MKTQFGLKKLLILVAAMGFSMSVYADAPSTPVHAPGAIVGVVRNRDKVPVSGATVTAVRTDGSAIRATLSGSDGIYSFADLPPGAWSITAQSDGYRDGVMTPLDVAPGRAPRADIVMAPPAMVSPLPPPAGPAPNNPPQDKPQDKLQD